MNERPPVEAPGLGRPAQPAGRDGPVLEAAAAPALEAVHEALAAGVRERVGVRTACRLWLLRRWHDIYGCGQSREMTPFFSRCRHCQRAWRTTSRGADSRLEGDIAQLILSADWSSAEQVS